LQGKMARTVVNKLRANSSIFGLEFGIFGNNARNGHKRRARFQATGGPTACHPKRVTPPT